MRVYLDHNATCPPLPEALETYAHVANACPGNPSSVHWAGRAARKALDDARESLANHFGVEPGSIVFTSGGTEANNLAIHGWLSRQKKGKIVASAIEHPSVLRPLERWQRQGWELVLVRPDENGVVQPEKMAAAIDEHTRLVCLMAANNETGVVQPVEEIGAVCSRLPTAFLVDAVQALGKMPVDIQAWRADFVSFSAHKIGGPKGVGALFIKRGIKIDEVLSGGGQERGRRSGTENVPGVAAFAASLGVLDFSVCQQLRDAFEMELLAKFPQAVVIGAKAERLPNTSMVHFPSVDGETLLMQLDLQGIAVASGSACSSGKQEPSHVLLAMGMQRDAARSSIRISFGPQNDMEDVHALVRSLEGALNRLMIMVGGG